MSAGVPHDALTSRVRSFIYGQWGHAGDERVKPALEALDALAAELARVSREHDELGRRYDALRGAYAREAARAREHETMRDALQEIADGTFDDRFVGAAGRARAALAGSRAATPEDA